MAKRMTVHQLRKVYLGEVANGFKRRTFHTIFLAILSTLGLAMLDAAKYGEEAVADVKTYRD